MAEGAVFGWIGVLSSRWGTGRGSNDSESEAVEGVEEPGAQECWRRERLRGSNAWWVWEKEGWELSRLKDGALDLQYGSYGVE